MSFFKRKPNAAAAAAANAKKEEPAPELTPLEKMLQNAGPVRDDGTDKFFGLENFGNTCYCNSIVQALYYSESFRENVVQYPALSPAQTPNEKRPRVNVTIRPKPDPNAATAAQKKATTVQALKPKPLIMTNGTPIPGIPPVRPEDRPDAPEYKKKHAMLKGPVLELAQQSAEPYGMTECTFTGLKDIFLAIMESNSRTGVLSPQRFLDIFRKDNEMFRNSMHQDAHEFYGLVLNDVISAVETNARRLQHKEEEAAKNGLAQSVQTALAAGVAGTRSPGTGWVHDIFEGVLTSETRCLTCETASRRDETFLDLSIDLEEHSSVTSCLRKFSAEEMLCERNKFHCDHCGGLQEAEKRMKIKRLPKVMALHLKRFKYSDDFTRLEKLFHRVVYPYQLRMFNTTDETEDRDRLYELYAVVVHIGGNAYHGHYVSVIKTKERGWLLFDDEMVEPVDKHFVRNFFGDKPGTACAYVLFYQETTHEKVRAEQEAEGLEEAKLANQKAAGVQLNGNGNGHDLSKQQTQPQPTSPMEDRDEFVSLDHAQTAPGAVGSPVMPAPVPTTAAAPTHTYPLTAAPPVVPTVADKKPTKEDKERAKKEAKAAEKAQKEEAKAIERKRKEQEMRLREARKSSENDLKRALEASKQSHAEEQAKNGEEADKVGASHKMGGFLSRANTGSKSLSRKSFGLLGKDKDKVKEALRGEGSAASSEGANGNGNAGSSDKGGKLKERLSFGLGRKKSSAFAS